MIKLTDFEIVKLAGRKQEDKNSVIAKNKISDINVRFMLGRNANIIRDSLNTLESNISNIEDKNEKAKAIIKKNNTYLEINNYKSKSAKLPDGKYSIDNAFLYVLFSELSYKDDKLNNIKFNRENLLYIIRYLDNLKDVKLSKDKALDMAHNINILREKEYEIRNHDMTKKYEEVEAEKSDIQLKYAKLDEQGEIVTEEKEVPDGKGGKTKISVIVFDDEEGKQKAYDKFNKENKQFYNDYQKWLNESIDIEIIPLSLEDIPKSISQQEMNILSTFIIE